MAIITISRGTLSGGRDLAQRLGEKLGYRVFSREVIVDTAKTYQLPESKLFNELESAPGLWARVIGQEEHYVLAIQATLADHVSEGKAIYHGIAGRFLLDGLPGIMRLRLIAPMPYRVNAAVAELGITREQAERRIRKQDRQRKKWVQALLGEDWGDPFHYDLTINLGDMTMDTAVDVAMALASSKDFEWNEKTARTIQDFAIKTRIRAHLRFLSPWPDLPVNVQVKNGVVKLSGNKAFKAVKTKVEKFVKKIDGISQLDVASRSEQVPESKDLLAKEVMIPLSRYPHIEESATLEDAIEAICNFTVPLDDGVVVPPRYVLVFDTNNTLKGILSRRDILRGLAPGYLNVKHALEQTPYGMPGMFDGFEQGFAWNSLFSPGALQNARNPVKGLMLLPAALVSIHDTVGTVVGAMLEHKVDLVPVLDGGRVVGLVLMTEIFEYVARYVLEHGTGPGASNRN